MTKKAVLAIDQGTTSSRAIVFSVSGKVISVSQQEFPQIFPHNGWVEHNPQAIIETTLSTAKQAVLEAGHKNYEVHAIGITNQRETVVVWDKDTGKPVYNAIVWQDRRTADRCEQLKRQKKESVISKKTGLLLDPYFSATKIQWILDHVKGARKKAEQGKLLFGTIDSFILWTLTGGTMHATDTTNASRTMLFNIHTLSWDKELFSLFDIPFTMAAEVKNSADDFGFSDKKYFGRSIAINSIIGDQQAATVGQTCFEKGSMKSTYGTGCFVLVNTGKKAVASKNRLLTTIAYTVNNQTTYALEGSIFTAGSAVQWLRDALTIIEKADETEKLADSLKSNGGVYFVPALTGLGAPYWNPYARGTIFGITRNTTHAHFVRATLESMCYQTHDLIEAIKADGVCVRDIRVDGGMVDNAWLLQFLANIVNTAIIKPKVIETTALGAAYFAALKAGFYTSLEDIRKHHKACKTFCSAMHNKERLQLLHAWRQAIEAVLYYSKKVGGK